MRLLSQTVPYQVDTVFSPFHACDFESNLATIKRQGFTGVELVVADPKQVDANRLRRQLEENGLHATTIGTGQPYALYGANMSSPLLSKRALAVDFMKAYIELSAELGRCPVTLGLLRGKLETETVPVLMGRLRDAVYRCLPFAEAYAVPIQLEAINKEETVLIHTTGEALSFIQEFMPSPYLGILYDTYHSYHEDGDMLAAIRAAGPKIMNVHFADSTRGLPGHGDIDFQSMYQTILATGYQGAIALETLPIPSVEFVREHGFESIKTIAYSVINE